MLFALIGPCGSLKKCPIPGQVYWFIGSKNKTHVRRLNDHLPTPCSNANQHVFELTNLTLERLHGNGYQWRSHNFLAEEVYWGKSGLWISTCAECVDDNLISTFSQWVKVDPKGGDVTNNFRSANHRFVRSWPETTVGAMVVSHNTVPERFRNQKAVECTNWEHLQTFVNLRGTGGHY